MFETGLLILTRPIPILIQRVQNILTEVSGKVSQTLYVHIQPSPTSHNAAFNMAAIPCCHGVRDLMTKLYSSNASVCHNLDIHVLLGNISNKNIHNVQYNFPKPYDVVLIDTKESFITDKNLLESIKSNFKPASENVQIDSLSDSMNLVETHENEARSEDSVLTTYPEVVMGGTFDRIHAGHKILLGEGCLLAENRLTVGVTDGPMTSNKLSYRSTSFVRFQETLP